MKLPTPLPFKVDFDHEGLTYTAELYPRQAEASEPQGQAADTEHGDEGGRIVEFIPGGEIIRVTLDGLEQEDPLLFEDSILRHLNATPGLRDGNFPVGSQMDVATYTEALLNEFLAQIQSLGLTGWIFCKTDNPMAFAALEQVAPGRGIFLGFSPRTRREGGRLSARINLFEEQHRRILSVIQEDVITVADMVEKYELPVRYKSGTWYEVGGYDLKTGTLKPLYENGEGNHPLLEIFVEAGLSPMDKDGAQRCAAGLVRLFLLLEELDRLAANKEHFTN